MVGAATASVVTVKTAFEAPAGMVTFAGTVATAGVPLDKEMRAPPLGAGPLKTNLPVEEVPPLTLIGLSVNELRVAADPWGVTVSAGFKVTPL
jgi:hypothetical protein